ncbi:MAG: hypothetical protein NTV34_06510 [Proteobacteria bacterium]|nr:hypothetical protein [Pseudomonadota bacterium]
MKVIAVALTLTSLVGCLAKKQNGTSEVSSVAGAGALQCSGTVMLDETGTSADYRLFAYETAKPLQVILEERVNYNTASPSSAYSKIVDTTDAFVTEQFGETSGYLEHSIQFGVDRNIVLLYQDKQDAKRYKGKLNYKHSKLKKTLTIQVSCVRNS